MSPPEQCSGEDILLGHLPMTKPLYRSKRKFGSYVIALQLRCIQNIIDLKFTWQKLQEKKGGKIHLLT